MRIAAIALAAGALAACATMSGQIEDGGRAARDTVNAPIAAPGSSEEILAEPWRVADRPIAGDRANLPQPDKPKCEAQAWTGLLGRTMDELQAMALPQSKRVLAHDALYTDDYVPSRLNIQFDDQGRVARVWCG